MEEKETNVTETKRKLRFCIGVLLILFAAFYFAPEEIIYYNYEVITFFARLFHYLWILSVLTIGIIFIATESLSEKTKKVIKYILYFRIITKLTIFVAFERYADSSSALGATATIISILHTLSLTVLCVCLASKQEARVKLFGKIHFAVSVLFLILNAIGLYQLLYAQTNYSGLTFFYHATSHAALLFPAALCCLGAYYSGIIETTSQKKIVSLGTCGLGLFAAGIIISLIIIIVSYCIWGGVYYFGYWYGILFWTIAIILKVSGLALSPFIIVYLCNLKQIKAEERESEGSGYISMGKHVLLLLFTFGIWQIIWIYKTTKILNASKDFEEQNPTAKTLLCLFVPFYSIYWFYKQGQRADALSRSRNLRTNDCATTCLVLGIFFPLIACIILQNSVNVIFSQTSEPVCKQSEVRRQPTAEDLHELKKPLDDGIITEEEFQAKKEEFLGK